MSDLHAAMIGFDITPRFHPSCGAWGTMPSMTDLDMPLLSRCLALDHGGRRLVWFGSDLVGDPPRETDDIRDEIAQALGLDRGQVFWSTSQTHSSGAIPGSRLSGSCVADLSRQDPAFAAAERKRLMTACIDAAKEALRRLQPATLWAGRGFCNTMSYNTRFPMPTGGVKFSRHHAEGLQSGKFFDPTVGLLRFQDAAGKTIGVIFNFCAHPATMINDKFISPDYVGTARNVIEAAVQNAPAMFLQGFCGDVNCYHMFGTPDQARRSGQKLGAAAVEALKTLVPVRDTPFNFASRTIDLPCQPMPGRPEIEHELAVREQFFIDLKDDPFLTWCGGINLPEHFPAKDRARTIEIQVEYLRKALHMLDTGEAPRPALPITLTAVRLGDAAAILSPGENFTLTGARIRERSPFAHTLIVGDTNGLFGYIGTDDEIDRKGYETDSFWKMLIHDGFRTPLAKAAASRVTAAALDLLRDVS
jgi:hypothetical protein